MGKLKLLACACIFVFGAALTGCNGATDLTDNGSGMTNDNGNGTIQEGDSTGDQPEIAEETRIKRARTLPRRRPIKPVRMISMMALISAISARRIQSFAMASKK